MGDASRLSSSPIVDLVDDGKTDDEIAALTDAWRLPLRDLPTVDIGVTAAEVLDELYADCDL